MLALSIRQPYAELILRRVKTIEYRSRATKIIGERFHIYASRNKSAVGSRPLAVKRADNIVAGNDLPPWMVELANALRLFPGDLPTGVIVGSAVIERVSQRDDGMYQWHLTGVERAKRLRKPKAHPQPVWWRPFD